MSIKDKIGKERLFFDGAMGTLLQEKGLKAGELPEKWNITNEDIIYNIHKSYIDAGCNILKSNTFGANSLKLNTEEFSVEKVVAKSVEIAKKAALTTDNEAYVALDLGPTGKLLKPYGELAFETAYCLYKEQVTAGARAGADLVLIETMGDTYEIKAAVLAAKENCDLPIIVTMIFDQKGKLLTGADIKTAVFILEGLGIDAIGFNCGFGPQQMLRILPKLKKYTSLPIVINPNAGLPECVNGVTEFNVTPDIFAKDMAELASNGAHILGGCCGTTPKHLKKAIELCKSIPMHPVNKKDITAVTSYSVTAVFGDKPLIVGERINPTGKKKLKSAIVSGDMGYIFSEAISQADAGAHILDVNVGLPEIDEPKVMSETVEAIQGITALPLQIDTSDTIAMEKALRLYNGKAMINSVNGKKESMEAVFPLAKKYGGVVVCLTLDENGIPDSAEGRIKIAEKIIAAAKQYGIEKKDLIIDTLAMTVSTGADNAKITLEALDYVKNILGVNTVLGVSNISFGLPERDIINSAFYTLAMGKGLSAGIINPKSESMMNAYYSYCALNGFDESFKTYISKASAAATVEVKTESAGLKTTVIKGLKEAASQNAKELLATTEPIKIINEYLIPALDIVGQGFENGTIFLPQLLMSADAAKAAFDEIKDYFELSGEVQEKKGKIVIATVKGDIHDIGKNIVKVLLENYGFEVIDLGKDVPPESVVETAMREKVRLVGLSALMTTTVANMEVTINQLHKAYPECKIMVGGAVITEEYSKRIGADFYSKDAMGSVRYAEKILCE